MSIFSKLFGKNDKPDYKAPDVQFLEENESVVTHTIPIAVSPTKQKIVIKEGDEVMIFDSINDVPENMREALKHLGEDGSHQSYSVIVNGERTTYDSIEDIPEEIRQSITNDGVAG
jgi:hypothetical protein